ncbi:DUF411 domain-containing protein [Patescibacteria group bacterium]
MKNDILTAFVMIFVALGGYYIFGQENKTENITESMMQNESSVGPKITVYKSPTCGCCVGYVGELEKEGFDVNMVVIEDMSTVKKEHNIPREMESCHTSVIDGYFIEGHVPISVVNDLIEEKPEIDGIALPNMPAGTPGMPGIKTKPWEIYQLIDGEVSSYLTL